MFTVNQDDHWMWNFVLVGMYIVYWLPCVYVLKYSLEYKKQYSKIFQNTRVSVLSLVSVIKCNTEENSL